MTTEAAIRLTQAIAASDYDWHDAEDVFFALDRDGTLASIVGEDGSVDATRLARAMKDLAKTRSWLLVDASTDTEPAPEDLVPSGANIGSGRHRFGLPGHNEAYLRARFPALNK